MVTCVHTVRHRPHLSPRMLPGEEHVSVFFAMHAQSDDRFLFLFAGARCDRTSISRMIAAKLIVSCGVIQPDAHAVIAEIGKKHERVPAYSPAPGWANRRASGGLSETIAVLAMFDCGLLMVSIGLVFCMIFSRTRQLFGIMF